MNNELAGDFGVIRFCNKISSSVIYYCPHRYIFHRILFHFLILSHVFAPPKMKQFEEGG